jgi:alkanesulfonate monooxygenase SsuD/methylene tetrahydromethanopterin reductase-like flavin-dependent oxidoreductase (luciferase family)
LIDHGERYDRMEEFIAVCQALWSSVDADAFDWDRLNGLVADLPRCDRSTMSAGSSR